MSESNEQLDELKEQIFGTNPQEGMPDIEALKKQMLDGLGNSDAMVQKQIHALMDEFNGMLGQITFNVLLDILEDDQSARIKTEIYTAWRSRIDEGLASADAMNIDESNHGGFNPAQIFKQSVAEADGHIKSFLNI